MKNDKPDAKFGQQILLRFAAFARERERRRLSRASFISVDIPESDIRECTAAGSLRLAATRNKGFNGQKRTGRERGKTKEVSPGGKSAGKSHARERERGNERERERIGIHVGQSENETGIDVGTNISVSLWLGSP